MSGPLVDKVAARGHFPVPNAARVCRVHSPFTVSRPIGEQIGLYKDWPVSKGCIPPYVPVAVEAMVKRKG